MKMKKLKFAYGDDLLNNREIIDEMNDFNRDVKVFTGMFNKWRQGIHTYQGGVLYNPVMSEFIINSSDDATNHYLTLRNRYRAIEGDFEMMPEEWQRMAFDELADARKSMEFLSHAIQQPITAGAVARKSKKKGATMLDRVKKISGVKL